MLIHQNNFRDVTLSTKLCLALYTHPESLYCEENETTELAYWIRFPVSERGAGSGNGFLFQYKHRLSRYMDFHYQDNTAVIPYHYNGNAFNKMVSLYIKRLHCMYILKSCWISTTILTIPLTYLKPFIIRETMKIACFTWLILLNEQNYILILT